MMKRCELRRSQASIQQFSDRIRSLFEVGGFDQVTVRTKLFGLTDVGFQGGRTQDENWQVMQSGLGSSPGQDIKAVEAWQFEIQHDELGQREPLPILKRPRATEILQRFPAIGNAAHG